MGNFKVQNFQGSFTLKLFTNKFWGCSTFSSALIAIQNFLKLWANQKTAKFLTLKISQYTVFDREYQCDQTIQTFVSVLLSSINDQICCLCKGGRCNLCYKCTSVYRSQVSPSFELGNKLYSLTVERDHILQILANVQNKLSKIHQTTIGEWV